MVLPVFLFACVILLMPFRILDVERQMQAVTERTAEDISQMAYVGGMSEELGEEELGSVLTEAAAYGYAQASVRAGVEKLPVEAISLGESQLLADGETVELVVKYEMRLPFSVLGLGRTKRVCRSVRRAWIGKAGGDGEGGSAVDGGDQTVYVGKGSTRYHKNPGCHYLDNHMQAVDRGQVEELRNQYGGRYSACSRCGHAGGSTVYVLPAGEHYHGSGSCSALAAYVREVPLCEVEHLGPCSYCSGG